MASPFDNNDNLGEWRQPNKNILLTVNLYSWWLLRRIELAMVMMAMYYAIFDNNESAKTLKVENNSKTNFQNIVSRY